MNLLSLDLPSNRTYRLAEIGVLSKNANPIDSDRYDHYSINVIFQEITIGNNKIVKYGQVTKRTVSINYMPLLVRGSVWRGNEALSLESVDILKKTITVDPTAVQIVNTDHLYQNFQIPVKSCIRQVIKNNFFLIDDGNNKYIIPCYEIARRFFFRSQNLVKKILYNELDNDKFVNHNKSYFIKDNDKRKAFIHLRPGLHKQDLFTVAWMHACNIRGLRAWEAVKEIALHVMKDKHSTRESFTPLNFRYPFDQTLSFNVSVEAIDKNLFLVHRIANCNIDLGYDDVAYDHDVDFRQVSEVDKNELEAIKSKSVIFKNPSLASKNVNDEVGAYKNSIATILFSGEEDITGNQPTYSGRIEKESQKSVSEAAPLYINNDDETVSTQFGDGDLHSPGKGEVHSGKEDIEESLNKKDKVSGFEKFQESILHLAKLGNDVKKIDLNDNYIFDDSKNDSWVKSKTYPKPRGYAFYHVTKSGANFYLFDIEDRPNEGFYIHMISNTNPRIPISKESLTAFKTVCQKKRGRKLKCKELLKIYEIEKFEHTSSQAPSEWAEKFNKAIDAILKK